MPLLPFRMIFRNRWTTLLWAGGICLSAVSFASHETPAVDAATAGESANAVQQALAAEDAD